ncbi:MAG: ABC transporter permease [Deltaproteobacteria bacterium]|nr:ABC transporter permease [Deltaproteobacteria bacterium]
MALRFLREGRMQTLLILTGVAFGVGVMIFVHALISGLQDTLIKQTLGSQAHVVVRPQEDRARSLSRDPSVSIASRIEKSSQRTPSIDAWQPILEQIEQVPGVVAAAPTVAGSAFVTEGNVSKSVALRGVDPAQFVRVINVADKIRSGEFRVHGTEAVIGAELAKDLGLGVGDKLRMVTAAGRSDIFTIRGIFDLGNKDVNQRWVFVSLRTAQTMLDLVGSISTIEVRVKQVFDAEAISVEVASRTGLVADSWMKLNQQLLIGLSSQNSSSYMIQFFVMLAVTLGIASVLVVSVVQKSREIGILKATGTSTRRVMRVFLIQGGIVGLLGAVIGSGIGTVLSLIFSSLAKNPDGSPKFPVDLNAGLFATALAVATVTGLLAAVAPARRAARLDPATVIRNG